MGATRTDSLTISSDDNTPPLRFWVLHYGNHALQRPPAPKSLLHQLQHLSLRGHLSIHRSPGRFPRTPRPAHRTGLQRASALIPLSYSLWPGTQSNSRHDASTGNAALEPATVAYQLHVAKYSSQPQFAAFSCVHVVTQQISGIFCSL